MSNLELLQDENATIKHYEEKFVEVIQDGWDWYKDLMCIQIALNNISARVMNEIYVNSVHYKDREKLNNRLEERINKEAQGDFSDSPFTNLDPDGRNAQ